jgi:hypothetical protein
MAANFGQRPFAYTPPTGFVALNTFNLPTPTIGATASTQANKYFDATLYTGNNQTAQTITGLNFQPDFLWIKGRSYADNHVLVDAVRTSGNLLYSNSTAAEGVQSPPNAVTSFNSNGFSLGTDGGGFVNFGTNTYVAWAWDANGTGVSNTAGSITSTVSANTSAGFSVVTWAGNSNSSATVGHGLGVTPSMIIIKNRTNGSTYWSTYHKSLASGFNVNLNETSAAFQPSSGSGGGGVGTSPSSTTFGFIQGTSNLNNVNATSSNYVAYCFSEVAGYSKFGSYTGNGSADGTFVYTGFRPKFVMIKNTTRTAEWVMFDAVRLGYNENRTYLRANNSAAEGTDSAGAGSWAIDLVSNGVKIRSTGVSELNYSGDTFVYMAFAENPYKYSLAR